MLDVSDFIPQELKMFSFVIKILPTGIFYHSATSIGSSIRYVKELNNNQIRTAEKSAKEIPKQWSFLSVKVYICSPRH